MTLWSFFTSRYTESLESQVAELRCQLAQERQEVRRLTEALVPSLQRRAIFPRTHPGDTPVVTAEDMARVTGKKPHHITKAEDQQSASCHCGWKADSDDPVELQTAISEHYKVAFPPVRAKRPSASERIQKLEADSLKESQNQRTQA